jgi:hypothetical protein
MEAMLRSTVEEGIQLTRRFDTLKFSCIALSRVEQTLVAGVIF